ncbi:hypothetical protein HDU88_007751 [Geranomyces variabilis]|nr:hypothetical protein HDU88_007751 [Geranomyces variabilis]
MLQATQYFRKRQASSSHGDAGGQENRPSRALTDSAAHVIPPGDDARVWLESSPGDNNNYPGYAAAHTASPLPLPLSPSVNPTASPQREYTYQRRAHEQEAKARAEIQARVLEAEARREVERRAEALVEMARMAFLKRTADRSPSPGTGGNDGTATIGEEIKHETKPKRKKKMTGESFWAAKRKWEPSKRRGQSTRL